MEQRIALGRQLLSRRTDTIEELDAEEKASYTWDEFNRALLIKLFSTGDHADTYSRMGVVGIPRYPSFQKDVERHRDFLSSRIRRLESVRDQLKLHDVPNAGSTAPVSGAAAQKIFVAYGHDEGTALKLCRFVEKRLGLVPVLMSDLPGKSRTIIEKFEETAADIGFCIAVFTPDDTVQQTTQSYDQARPNVLFELGWFCAELGRENTLIVCKRGTKIPSDLEGIQRADFVESVDEKFVQIEQELREAKLL
ncbi:MAG: nucleotide-binding protein [Armatimonadota bacterium]